MDWVKLMTGYYGDLSIATKDDAAEVMFTRGLAYCGDHETGGFIPDSQLHHLTRRPASARRTANSLTVPGPGQDEALWVKVTGGYQVRNWERHQAELEALLKRRQTDRVRKARERDRNRSTVTGLSRDMSMDQWDTESKSKKKTAAAAAAADDLPTAIAILRDKLQAHTALQGLRFDGLTLDKQIQLEVLIEKHGDQRLVDTALRTLRTPPPVHVSAFLGTWEALPAPGQRLSVVKEPECPTHPGKPARTCTGCAADRLAGDR